MRRFSSLSLTRPRSHVQVALRCPSQLQLVSRTTGCLNQSVPSRSLAQVRDDKSLSELWFSSALPRAVPELAVKELGQGQHGTSPQQPPDERTLKLGKTISILHDRLPVLLNSPLPQDILSPQICLHLFPSTHPHLPTVSGRLAYSAALWTAPMAWGRVPVVGNVRLIIISERMIKNGNGTSTNRSTPSRYRNEKLIVRWRTCGKSKGRGMGAFTRALYGGQEQVDKITEFLGGRGGVDDDEEFSGLFIFEFDEEGRIVEHTIEHAQEGRNFEKMTRVVSVTDWLLGLAKGTRTVEEPGLALGYCEVGPREHEEHIKRLQQMNRRCGG